VPTLAVGLAYFWPRSRSTGWGGRVPGTLAAAALTQTFVWMNLEISNHFAPGNFVGPFVSFAADRLSAANVNASLAWGVFALLLLGLGSFGSKTQAPSSAPCWASLGLFALAIGKVRLFDLRHLESLWRVASLVGLAAARILLSMLYQCFVFKKEPT